MFVLLGGIAIVLGGLFFGVFEFCSQHVFSSNAAMITLIGVALIFYYIGHYRHIKKLEISLKGRGRI